MPYSSLDELPDNIRKKPEAQQRQWMAAFNSAFADCDGDGCEAQAFRIANAAIKPKKATKAHSGFMVALMVPESVGQQLLVEDGEPLEDLHVTLVHSEAIPGSSEFLDMIRGLEVIAREFPLLVGRYNGVGRFIETHKDDMHVVYASPDLPHLPALRQKITDFLDYLEIPYSTNHGYVPHTSLAYAAPDVGITVPIEKEIPVTFPALSLVVSGNRFDFPFGGSMNTGEIVKTRREELGLSLEELAEKAGIDIERLTNIEAGKSLGIAIVETLAKSLDMSISDLLGLPAEAQDEQPEAEKAGARHSSSDRKMVQTIHDYAKNLGAMCGEEQAGKALPDMPYNEIIRRVSAAWIEQHAPADIEEMAWELRPWVTDVFPTYVVVTTGENMMRYDYTMDEQGDIAFIGGPVKVDHPYVPAKALAGSNHLKTVGRTDDEIILANYMILWDGRDLEGTVNKRRNRDGSKGEYFTKGTVLESDYTQIDAVIVDWEHGQEPEGKGISPSADEPLGRVLWKSVQKDNLGLWAKRALNRRNQYVQLMDNLGWFDPDGPVRLGNSTEAIPESVEKADNGEILTWRLRRDTLSFSPMEPRMLVQNELVALKALTDQFPELKSYYKACAAMSEADDVSSDSEAKALLLELELMELEV